MKDSIGSAFPKGISVLLSNTGNEEPPEKAIMLNTFLLACNCAIRNGKQVIYDKDEKSETITDSQGFKTKLYH